MLGSSRNTPQPRRRRLLAGLGGACTAVLTAGLLATGTTAGAAQNAADGPGAQDRAAAGKVVGYFTEWGVYERDYHVKDVESSGAADRLTHLNYAFGNVQGGECSIGDAYAAINKAYPAVESVNGAADNWEQPLRGNFNQLRQLKEKHPDLKILWSFGGWNWSPGFTEAAKNPERFAKSCHDLVNDPRWKGLFDGIDIDWEYPNACGRECDESGPQAFTKVMRALRAEFGQDQLLTAAITADASDGGKIDATDYGSAAPYVDWYLPMTYNYFGPWAAKGPTAPHSPLHSYDGIPAQGLNTADTIAKLKGAGVPAQKLLIGLGFYGHGWAGVTQSEPGGTATGPAAGKHGEGIEDYEDLKARCPADGTVGGTAYAHCGTEWWSYDTPQTIRGKSAWARDEGLGGTFVWELSGDTGDGELIKSIG